METGKKMQTYKNICNILPVVNVMRTKPVRHYSNKSGMALYSKFVFPK